MKRRVVFSHLSKVRYDSIDDMFEEVPIEDIQNEDMENRKRKREREKEKNNGCFAGFLGFFRILMKK
jgi:hypothetical protein